jgi:hypothetical protein
MYQQSVREIAKASDYALAANREIVDSCSVLNSVNKKNKTKPFQEVPMRIYKKYYKKITRYCPFDLAMSLFTG